MNLAGNSVSVEGTVTNNGMLQQSLDVPTGSTTEFLHIQNAASDTDKYLGVEITNGQSVSAMNAYHWNDPDWDTLRLPQLANGDESETEGLELTRNEIVHPKTVCHNSFCHDKEEFITGHWRFLYFFLVGA